MMIMRKQTLNQILKIISLILSWATLSPLLLILDGRWKMLPKWLRIMLFVLSPLTIAVLGILVLLAYDWNVNHYRQHHFTKRSTVENITGVSFPRFKVVSVWTMPHSSKTEYKDFFTLEFCEMPNEAFYEELEKNFYKNEEGEYCFSAIWGNGQTAPKGERSGQDHTFDIKVPSDSKTFEIVSGTW